MSLRELILTHWDLGSAAKGLQGDMTNPVAFKLISDSTNQTINLKLLQYLSLVGVF